jgi:DNA invertase Pin-like site-specific DNA recombinase
MPAKSIVSVSDVNDVDETRNPSRNCPTPTSAANRPSAALYARVSTTGHGQTVEPQLLELREYCTRRGWNVTGEFIDSGVSGAKERRPELDRLMADARRRRFDAVIVYRYDRFARSLRHLVNALEEFRALGIDFVSLHEGVDTSTPNGRLICGIFASIAEFERELIRQRVRSGLAAARARGKRLGRPSKRVDADCILTLHRSGRSIRQIAAEAGCSRSLVHKTLRKRTRLSATESAL